MSMDCFTFRSITPAQRGQSVLRQGGVMAGLQRTPRRMEKRGCGYCLRVRSDQRQKAIELLTRAKIEFQTIYNAESGERVVP